MSLPPLDSPQRALSNGSSATAKFRIFRPPFPKTEGTPHISNYFAAHSIPYFISQMRTTYMALLNAKVRSRLKHAIIRKFKHMATKAGNCYTTHSFILLFLLTENSDIYL